MLCLIFNTTKMKTLKYILPILSLLFITSCTKNDENILLDETAELHFIKTLSNTDHDVEVFSTKSNLEQGYNNLYIRIREKATDMYVENASITWKPIMNMMMMKHSSPKSEVTKTEGKRTLYNGYIVFQMAENATEKWDLTIDYTVNNITYTIKDLISVSASVKKNVAVFMKDNVKYVMVLIDPKEPKVGLNNFKIGLYKMENMMSFLVVENYMIKQDPRMPSMGNHSSPNNTDLIFDTASNIYEGNISFTMTGYWKLNFMLYNATNQLVKGEEVTANNDSSSLFLEIEF